MLPIPSVMSSWSVQDKRKGCFATALGTEWDGSAVHEVIVIGKPHNSCEAHCVPLSDTAVAGMPFCAKIDRRAT